MKINNILLKKSLFNIMTLSTLFSLNSFAHTTPIPLDTSDFKVLSLHTGNNYETVLKDLRKNGEDVLGVDFRNKIINIHSKNERIKHLKKYLIKTEAVTHNEKRVDDQYLNPQEVYDLLKKASETYPEITKLIKVGQSLEGEDIYAIKISDNAETEDSTEPNILFNGMHHSREVMTAEVTTDIVTYLTNNYNKDSNVTKWVNNNEIYILPMLNVDGNKKVWQGNNMWRKNTRGGYGVDINRNYPTDWNKCRGSSGWRNSQTYRGSAPASEPETNVLMNFVSDIKPVFNISYHAYSELVIYPKGCRGERTENKEVVEGIGKELGKVLDYEPGTAWELLYSVDGSDIKPVFNISYHAYSELVIYPKGCRGERTENKEVVEGIGKELGKVLDYEPGTAWELLYSVDGSDIDWMYAQEQVIPYVIEVSPSRDGFQPPYSKRNETVERNRSGWQYLLERLEGPSIHGVTKDYSTIRYKNKNGSDYRDYTINPDGSYHLIVNSGEYDLEFIGKKNKKISLRVDNRINLKL